MHEAYEVSHLLNLTVQIEAIAAYDGHLILGTRQGHLMMYSLSSNNGNQKYELQLLQYCKGFSKKPIQQIEVIPVCLMRVVQSPLCMGCNKFEDLVHFLLECGQIEDIRNKYPNHLNMFNGGINVILSKPLSDDVMLVYGFIRHAFAYRDNISGQGNEDNLLLCLTDNILTTHDIKGANFPLIKTFSQTKGASLFSIDNKSQMSMTGESNSVVRLCVAVRRKLQLYYGKNGEFKPHLFDFNIPDVPKVMAWGTEYICVGFKAEYTLYDLSSGNPKELFPTSSSRSLEPTVAKYSETCFMLGRDLTSVLVEEAKEIEIRNTVKWQAAPIGLVWDEPYLLGLMQDDNVVVQTVEPAIFVQTLPELNKARLMYRCNRGLIFAASVGQVWCITSVDINKQIQQLLKDKQFQIAINLTNLNDCPPEDKKQRINSIKMLLALELFDNKQYAQAMDEFGKLNTDPADVIKLFPELDNKPGGKTGKLKPEDLEKALNALVKYLLELRSRKSSASEASGSQDDPSQRNVMQQLELIDITLLKCYLQINDALIAPLLRLNNCRLEEAEKILVAHGKHSELVILYQTKGQHLKALQLLKEQAKQPDSSLKGYNMTKKYLQQLGAEHVNLIFKFSDWIIRDHPEEGLKIFTEDKIEVETLPRPKVLDFLLREHETLVVPYLEHVIHTWNDTSSIFHDALISMYREKITDKKPANMTEEELQHTKAKLLAFLEKSSSYTPERVILHFPADSLFEERAVILEKLGRHEQALAIYVQILGDVDKAIQYCNKTYDGTNEKKRDIYIILLRILMNPQQSSVLSGPLANVPRHPKTAVPDLETALDILAKHADKISPVKALSVLPDSVPLARLKTFLESALDNQLSLKRKTQVLKGLLYAENQQVQELKQFHESKSVIINDYNVCPVCKKRFGNQSAFVRYPNGDIVHYSCRLDQATTRQ